PESAFGRLSSLGTRPSSTSHEPPVAAATPWLPEQKGPWQLPICGSTQVGGIGPSASPTNYRRLRHAYLDVTCRLTRSVGGIWPARKLSWVSPCACGFLHANSKSLALHRPRASSPACYCRHTRMLRHACTSAPANKGWETGRSNGGSVIAYN